jgi:hypothetical protein
MPENCLPKRFRSCISPKYDKLPATLLGRLARSREFKGAGVGELLLMGALQRALDHSKNIASLAVVVDAKKRRKGESLLSGLWFH